MSEYAFYSENEKMSAAAEFMGGGLFSAEPTPSGFVVCGQRGTITVTHSKALEALRAAALNRRIVETNGECIRR
jgi:hypothetical protein